MMKRAIHYIMDKCNILNTETRRHRTFLFSLCLCASVFQILLLGSCVKDDLYDTPHPDRGVIAVAMDLPAGTASDDFTVETGGTLMEKKENSYIVSEPLMPGEYSVLAHNTPQGFTIADGIARVNVADASRALSTLIEPLPGCLYSGTERIRVIADDTVRVSLDVAQRTRDLHLRLTVTEGNPERIATVKGTLSGVAGAYDMRQEVLCGDAVSTAPVFTRTGDKVSADLRLLGTMGDTQTLTLEITFTDGDTQTVESGLTEPLAAFNSGTEAVTLAGDLHTPTEIGMGSSTITPWEVVDGGNVSAD